MVDIENPSGISKRNFSPAIQILNAHSEFLKKLGTFEITNNNKKQLAGFTEALNALLNQSTKLKLNDQEKNGIDLTLKSLSLNESLQFQFCSPLALFLASTVPDKKKVAKLIQDGRLQSLESLYKAEAEFKDVFDQTDLGKEWRKQPVGNWPYLLGMIRPNMPVDKVDQLNTVSKRGELFELFKEHDIFDKHVRAREAKIKDLKLVVNTRKGGDEEDILLSKLLEVGLDAFETFKLRVLTFRMSPTDDARENPMSDEIWDQFEIWMKENLDEQLFKKIRHDKFLYDSAHWWYPWITDKALMFELVVTFFVIYTLDDMSENCELDVLQLVIDMLDKKEISAERWEKVPQHYRLGIQLYVKNTFAVDKLEPAGDIVEANKDMVQSWVDAIIEPHQCFNSIEAYFEKRNVHAGGYLHLAILSGSLGYSWKELPDKVIDEVLKYVITENDFNSFGKELLSFEDEKEKGEGTWNIVFVYKHLHPELSYQECIWALEPFKNQNNENILPLKGTNLDYLYMSSMGVAYDSKTVKRYLKTNVVSKNTCLSLLV